MLKNEGTVNWLKIKYVLKRGAEYNSSSVMQFRTHLFHFTCKVSVVSLMFFHSHSLMTRYVGNLCFLLSFRFLVNLLIISPYTQVHEKKHNDRIISNANYCDDLDDPQKNTRSYVCDRRSTQTAHCCTHYTGTGKTTSRNGEHLIFHVNFCAMPMLKCVSCRLILVFVIVLMIICYPCTWNAYNLMSTCAISQN